MLTKIVKFLKWKAIQKLDFYQPNESAWIFLRFGFNNFLYVPVQTARDRLPSGRSV